MLFKFINNVVCSKMCFHGLDYRGVSHGTSSIFHLPSYIIHLSCSNMSKIALPTAVSELIDDAKVDKPRNCAKLSA